MVLKFTFKDIYKSKQILRYVLLAVSVSFFFPAWVACAADLVPVEELGLRVTRGFRVTQFADADLANDIYAMTLDARGNVVVTGQGYIRTLFDLDGDGRADTFTNFARTVTGGMGICFDGNDLYFCGDGYLSRYRDADGDGQADGAPENLLPLNFAEHGGHAMRKGPDGWWYVIAGNETHFSTNHITLPGSPIRQIEGGALLRLTPDGLRSEAIAQGFRNPYDFDFNWLGDLFTYDSDGEGDLFLPWYSPTRIYQIGYAGHHGWRLEGWQRTWARPDYYSDTVDILYPIGRGSPTGVACYRHFQFPTYFQNGLFALDWVFGRVYFLPLQPNGASYRATPEVFLESMGTHGFDPTDIVVTPDGALLISIGGRKTRGAIYRIDYVGQPNMAFFAGRWMQRASSPLETVLGAPQPLDAWSRAIWVPLAQQLGPEPFAEVLANNRMPPAVRIRAVEILTELFGGLDANSSTVAARANSSFVRARGAWSLGRVLNANCAAILSGLTRDADSQVRRCALEAMADRARSFDNASLQQALAANLGHAEKRVRQCAARLATYLPDLAWKALWAQQAKGAFQSRLTTTLALLWRSPRDSINATAIESALSVLGQTKSQEQRLEAIRLIILALGDYRLRNPSIEVYTGYEPALPIAGQEKLAQKVRETVRQVVPSGDSFVDGEAWRLLAMLEDDAADSPARVLSYLTEASSPTADFHFLTVLSRLKAPIPTNSHVKIVHSVLSLDRKLQGQEQRPKQNWSARLTEAVQVLLQRDQKLADAFLASPELASPSHVGIATSLGSGRSLTAARLFASAVQRNAQFSWSGPLIDLLAALPAEEACPLFRRQWSNLILRDDLLLKLAQKPSPIDRDKFITGLSSIQPKVAQASLRALLELAEQSKPQATDGKKPVTGAARPNSGAIVPALRLLQKLENEPKEQETRGQLVALLNREAGCSFKILELGTSPANLKRAYQPVFDWFTQRYPGLTGLMGGGNQQSAAQWTALLKRVRWERGDPSHGEAIFTERGCQICHSGATPLGPDLGGVTSRFSIEDLMNAIIFPSRDVAPPYRTTAFRTRDGENYIGIVVFESADGVIVQTGAANTVRLAESDIMSREPTELSLMPEGLLLGLEPSDLADLYSYLKTLQPKGR